MSVSQYTVNAVIHNHDTGDITVRTSMVTLTPDTVTFTIQKGGEVERVAIISINAHHSPETVTALALYGIASPQESAQDRQAG